VTRQPLRSHGLRPCYTQAPLEPAEYPQPDAIEPRTTQIVRRFVRQWLADLKLANAARVARLERW
jgi:hypothetical protein